MRIVIDMQGAQTQSRFRGIGRYTLSFAHSIAKHRGNHEVILALNGIFSDTIAPIRAAFDDVLPQENIRVWYAPTTIKEAYSESDWQCHSAELIREAFLASLMPDIIHVSSLFEDDGAAISIKRLGGTCPVSVTLYDLIPLLNPEHYLHSDSRYTEYYQQKINYLQRATLLLAISDSARQEGIKHLEGFSPERIINVSCAIDPFFQPLKKDDSFQPLPSRFGLTRPFVFYAGGSDKRKNLPRLLHAYANLPNFLRSTHQLLLAGKLHPEEEAQLRQQAKALHLTSEELLFTGYVSDNELVQLYQQCQLFVFPSWHEGFGLPALEAMACGAPVIGSQTSSIPEVIGWDKALFDPFNISSINEKIVQALTDAQFRLELSAHGLKQAQQFSWAQTAQYALNAWESLAQSTTHIHPPLATTLATTATKPHLIFVSPLPPQRSGIANYSAELLLPLSEHYDIDVVVFEESMAAQISANGHFRVRDINWFWSHAPQAPRVLYQFGNSSFHAHMFQALEQIPGIVVLHDFFLSGIVHYINQSIGQQDQWLQELYYSHGYVAAHESLESQDQETQIIKYPCNRRVLEGALAIIVHSEYSKQLINKWYGVEFQKNINIIPLLRTPAAPTNKYTARQQLGLEVDSFIVCSFGFLAESKLNHRLLNAWLKSQLFQAPQSQLIFVGENHKGHYGASLLHTIRTSGVGNRVHITGFATADTYQRYLACADLVVQLRTQSRGETSGAVLDCMNHGLPLIINANGSMAELNPDAVWMLPDDFDDAELINALETLWHNPTRRTELGTRARAIIEQHHTPAHCALGYVQAIEQAHEQRIATAQHVVQAITAEPVFIRASISDTQLQQLAQAIATTLPPQRTVKRLLLDITATRRYDLRTGIERVVRALIRALLLAPAHGYRIEPVYLHNAGEGWHYRSASQYTLQLLGSASNQLPEDIIDPEHCDTILTLDIAHELTQAQQAGLFTHYRQRGVRVLGMVYDLLPVTLPKVFPPQAEQGHAKWLETVLQFDGAVCISNTVAKELTDWHAQHPPTLGASDARKHYTIDWFHLGADIEHSAPSQGIPVEAPTLLAELQRHPSFLMVGTIEPRKGYLQVLQAFDQLWRRGLEVHLVIVGRTGWKDLPISSQRDIPATLEALNKHPQKNRLLHWIDNASDEYLEKIYAASTCLIAASYGEGFGLPLIEAAQHKLPIMARDIPVFREVAGEHAYYFDGLAPEDLASAIERWLALHASGQHPRSDAMPWLTWAQSAQQLLQRILPASAQPSSQPLHNTSQISL